MKIFRDLPSEIEPSWILNLTEECNLLVAKILTFWTKDAHKPSSKALKSLPAKKEAFLISRSQIELHLV